MKTEFEERNYENHNTILQSFFFAGGVATLFIFATPMSTSGGPTSSPIRVTPASKKQRGQGGGKGEDEDQLLDEGGENQSQQALSQQAQVTRYATSFHPEFNAL